MSSKMKKIKYQKRPVGTCFSCVIKQNQGMLILARFVTENNSFMSGSRKLMLNILKNGENKISETSCGVLF